MITESELNPRGIGLSGEQVGNFARLLFVMNVIRKMWDKPMVVTGPIRSVMDQVRIDQAAGRKPRLGSAHIRAAACDIRDSDGALKRWVKQNEDLMVAYGVHLEAFDYTRGWVHFQIVPPKSGKLYFIPY